MEEMAQKESSQQPADDGDELARSAAVLLESVKDETNPKFQNSQFLGLMKQLRDGEMVVEGNQMVESDGRTSSKVDVKGKGRAVDHVLHSTLDNPDSGHGPQSSFLDANDSYFQQENADYIRYWNESQVQPQSPTEESLSWDYLQDDWENFEATAAGIKAMTHYQFQENNPYLLGDSTATRQHLVHTYGRQSVFEVCPFSSPATHLILDTFRMYLNWRLQSSETWKMQLLGLN
jgi:peroxin-5